MANQTKATPLHRCRAVGCRELIDARRLFCDQHWALCPRYLQAEVRQHFRFGQETGRVRPSQQWLDAADKAIAAVAELEHAAA